MTVSSPLVQAVRNLAFIIAIGGLILLGCVGLANCLNFELGWIGLLAHFPIHCGLASLFLFAILIRHSRPIAAVALSLGIGFLIQVGLLWKPGPQPSTSLEHSPLHLLSFNVFRENRQYSKVLSALENSTAEILYLTEMTPDWFRELVPLEITYPHRLASGQNLLLSKYPLKESRSVSTSFDEALVANRKMGSPLMIGEDLRQHWWNTGILITTVNVGSCRLHLAGIHSPTPRSQLSLLIQKACGLVASYEISKDCQSGATVILGDLNTTCFSPTFRFIIQKTGLRDSSRGFGYSPTWGPRLPREPWLPWVGAGIDQILVSENVRVLKHETGPQIGSDHLWVYAEIDW